MNLSGRVQANHKIYSDNEELYEQLYNSEKEEGKVNFNKKISNDYPKVPLSNLNPKNQSPKILTNEKSFEEETRIFGI